jgi:imidazolonepropionase-like amidohydrolase
MQVSTVTLSHVLGRRTGRAVLAAIALAGLSTFAAAQSPAAAGRGLVIRDVTVVSPERPAPLEHAYVRVLDGRIAEVSTSPLDGTSQIDGRGRFLIPGLIDSHVHLRWLSGMTDVQQTAHRDLVAAAEAQEPRSFLYFGFTTVLSLGDVAEPIQRWNALDIRPDAYFCGGTPVLNGYGFQSFEQARYFIYNPEQAALLPASVDKADHTPEAVVNRMARDGAICVKSYHESGYGPNVGKLPVPSLAAIRTIVATARQKNMRVFIHANSKTAQEFAVSSGADVMAHGMWNGHELKNGALAEDVQAILRNVVQRGMGYQPTSQVIRGLRTELDSKFLSDPLLTHVYPSALLAWYGTKEAGWFREQELGNVPPQVFDGASALGDAVVTWLARNNGRLLFGTDTPSAPVYTNPPGLNAFYEMRRWSAAGVSPKQILSAATIENARLLRMDRDIGSVEKGKRAHLLLLRSSPLESVEAYNTIETVFLAGKPIKREELSARNAPGR